MKKPFNWQSKEQKKSNSLSASTGTKKAPSSSPSPLNSSLTSSCLLRRTCSEVSVAVFRKAHCHKDFAGLIISGTPTQEQLQQAWEEIIFEYSGLVRTDMGESLHELSRQAGELKAHIIYVEHAVKVLKLRHYSGQEPNAEIVEELKAIGYYGDYDHTRPEAYLQQLNAVNSLCKTKVFDLGMLEDEYSRLSNTVEGKQQTEEDFLKNVVMLKKWGYKIDMNETMMDEYAQAMNLYIREVSQHKNKTAA